MDKTIMIKKIKGKPKKTTEDRSLQGWSDIILEINALDNARAEAKNGIKYPLNEYPDYDIVDVIAMLQRHRNKKITDSLIKQVQWELKS